MRAKATVTIEWELATPDEYEESVASWQEAARNDWGEYFYLDSEIDMSYDLQSLELEGDPELEKFERNLDVDSDDIKDNDSDDERRQLPAEMGE